MRFWTRRLLKYIGNWEHLNEDIICQMMMNWIIHHSGFPYGRNGHNGLLRRRHVIMASEPGRFLLQWYCLRVGVGDSTQSSMLGAGLDRWPLTCIYSKCTSNQKKLRHAHLISTAKDCVQRVTITSGLLYSLPRESFFIFFRYGRLYWRSGVLPLYID